jgi:hypothetical protein
MKAKFTLATIISLSVVGCAPIQQQQTYQAPVQTQAQVQANQNNARIQSVIKASTECAKTNRSTPAGEIVTKYIIVFDEAQPNKFDLLSSKAKLSESQKTAFKQFLSANAACRKMKVDGYAGTPYQSIQVKSDSDRDLIYTKLLTGQMNVGDANTAIKQLNLQVSDAFKAAAADLNQNVRNQSNAEIANRNRQQMCNGLAAKLKEVDPSQNSWLAFQNGLDAANARAGNFGNGGVAMVNNNQQQQQQLVARLQEQYMRNCQ